MAESIIRLERQLAALEQKVSTEQAMRVALLTDITARLDMLEHRAGDAPPPDPASEAPLTRAEAEEIAKTCAQAAAALPEAPSYLTTVNMRGWRPHAWVVDAVIAGAGRSGIGQGDMKAALSELTDALKRDQTATCVRIAKIVGVYHDDFDDDDGYDLDGVLGVLEADMAKLRKDASGACEAQRAAMVNRDELRDQRNAMRAERDQALARVRELEQQVADSASAGCMGCVAYEVQFAEIQQHLAKASADTVQAMESAASAAARVLELEAQMRGMHDRLCGATGSNRADTHDVVIGSIAARLGRLQELELRVASLESMPDSDWWRRQVQCRQVTIDDQTELIARMTADLAAAKERHDQLFAGAQSSDTARESEHRLLSELLRVIGCETYEGAVARVRETKSHILDLEFDLHAIMAECDNSSDNARDVISTISDLKAENTKLKAESIADVMAQIEKLRGQVANMSASVQWRDSYERMEQALAGALGSPVGLFSFSGLIDHVRELKARAAGVVHE